jgi:MFS family permease
MTPASPERATPRQQLRISLYFSVLLVGVGMHSPSGLFSLPIVFYFKNTLHLSSQLVSYFGLVTAIPLYLSFVFGLVRDAWQPRRLGDRGYLLLGGLGLTATYLAMAAFPPTWTSLLIGTLNLSFAYLVVSTASSALITLVGQQRLMTGRLSALFNFVGSVPVILSFLVGGALSDNWSLRNVFLLMAAISATLWLQAFWRPRDIFSQASDSAAVSEQAPKSRLDIRLLLRHRGALLAALIWMMWNFAPGANTATMYYLTNTVHLTDAQYGQYQAVFTVAFCPIYACYGFLCRRYSLRTLLFWGTIVAIPQLIPILFIHSANSAMVVAALMGGMGAVGTAAYYDLLIRACPKGLEGTLMMIAGTGFWIFGKWGDLLGSWLYEHWKYLPCVAATTIVYALILVVLFFIPPTITQDTEEHSENRRQEYALDSPLPQG